MVLSRSDIGVVMKFIFGKNNLKAAAVILCAVITSGTITYGNYGNNTVKLHAKTVSDLEAEKAENQKEIDSLQNQIDSLKDDVSQQKAYQQQLQEKIKLQSENIDNVNTIINNLNTKIDEKEEKIVQLEKDISQKEKDIEEGLELFKERLRAMYISGNDSLASALVGSTDFYDMLSKIELISQVAKHDDELINNLNNQLSQYKEAKTQLDIERDALNSDLSEQESNREELRNYMSQLQADYEESEDYISRKNADLASRQRDAESLKADNDAMDDEIQKINDEIERQRKLAIEQDNERKQKQQEQQQSYSQEDDDEDDDYYTDNSDDSDDNNSSNDTSSSDDDQDSGYSAPDGDGIATGTLSWPVPGFYSISSGFGYRWGTNHNGIDIAGGGISGATITAADGGTVVTVATGCSHNYGKDSSCGCNGGWGNYVVIDHGNGITTLYAHCTDVFVSVGQSVSANQAIASVGSTGYSTGAHCHFQVTVNGSVVDPTNYLY